MKEYSELVNCSVRYTQKLIQIGKLKAEKDFNPKIKQICYMIPLSELPEEIQVKYYDRLRSKTDIPVLNDGKTAKKHCF